MNSPTVCLVTGASSGIGGQLCRQLVKSGHFVIGVARNCERLQQLQQELGVSHFKTYTCDTSVKSEVAAVCEDIRQHQLVPKIFFLNAGAGELELEINSDLHRKIFDTNYFGALYWIEEWQWTLREKGAQFVAISSLAAIRASPKAAAYGASKAALKACIESLRVKHLNTPIGFTVVMPGPVATKLLNRQVSYSLTTDRAARRIIVAAFKKERSLYFPFVWAWIYRFLAVLPDRYTAKILG